MASTGLFFQGRSTAGEEKLISQKVVINSSCKNQFPHKFVNLFFISAMMKDKLTDLCVN
jgi:hypothetical protein